MNNPEGLAPSEVAVVMITKDRRDETLQTLTKLFDVSGAKEVIVVDNGSSDGTVEAVRDAFPDVTAVDAGENLGAAGRNLGVRCAKAPYVAFADDDSWWAPGALDVGAGLLDDNQGLGLLAAKVLVRAENRVDPVCRLMASSRPPVKGVVGIPVTGFVACGAIVRKEAFLEVGGFHSHFGMGAEETLLALDMWTAGWSVEYFEDLVAHHWPSAGPRSGRKSSTLRNEMWTLWLRRPLLLAVRGTVSLVRGNRGEGRTALAMALKGLPWVLRDRRQVSSSVERLLELAESERDSFDGSPGSMNAA